jgi:hypothetical protein
MVARAWFERHLVAVTDGSHPSAEVRCKVDRHRDADQTAELDARRARRIGGVRRAGRWSGQRTGGSGQMM